MLKIKEKKLLLSLSSYLANVVLRVAKMGLLGLPRRLQGQGGWRRSW